MDKKGLGFKWFNFLYGWFVYKIIMDSIGVLSGLVQIKGYESMYGTYYEISELASWIIFCTIISIILKIVAVSTKHEESGYKAVNVLLFWELISWCVWGLQYGAFGAVLAPLVASVFIIPTHFYLKKRKFAYGICDGTNVQKTVMSSSEKRHAKIIEKGTDRDEIKFCRKCGEGIAPKSIFCKKCGTKISTIK